MTQRKETVPQETVVSDVVLHLLLQNQGNAHKVVFVGTEVPSSREVVHRLIVKELDGGLVEQAEREIVRNSEGDALI